MASVVFGFNVISNTTSHPSCQQKEVNRRPEAGGGSNWSKGKNV